MNRIQQIGLVKKINRVELTPGVSLSEQNALPENIWNLIFQKLGANGQRSLCMINVNKSFVITVGNMRATCKAFYNLPLPLYFKSLRKYCIEWEMCNKPYSVPGKKLRQTREQWKKVNQLREDEWYYGKGYIYCPKPTKLELSPYRYYEPSKSTVNWRD